MTALIIVCILLLGVIIAFFITNYNDATKFLDKVNYLNSEIARLKGDVQYFQDALASMSQDHDKVNTEKEETIRQLIDEKDILKNSYRIERETLFHDKDVLQFKVENLTKEIDSLLPFKSDANRVKDHEEALEAQAKLLLQKQAELNTLTEEIASRQSDLKKKEQAFDEQSESLKEEHRNTLEELSKSNQIILSNYKENIRAEFVQRENDLIGLYEIKYIEAIEKIKNDALASVVEFDSSYDKSFYDIIETAKSQNEREEQLKKTAYLQEIESKIFQAKDINRETKDSIMNVMQVIKEESSKRELSNKDILNLINSLSLSTEGKMAAIKFFIEGESKDRNIGDRELQTELKLGLSGIESKVETVKHDLDKESQRVNHVTTELKSYVDLNVMSLSKDAAEKFQLFSQQIVNIRQELSKEVLRLDSNQMKVVNELESMHNRLNSFKLTLDGVQFVAEKQAWEVSRTLDQIHLEYQSFNNTVESSKNFIANATAKFANEFKGMTTQVNQAKLGLDKAALELYHNAQEIAMQKVGVNILIEQHQKMKTALLEEIDQREVLMDSKLRLRQQEIQHGREVLNLDGQISVLREEVAYRRTKIAGLEDMLNNYRRYSH